MREIKQEYDDCSERVAAADAKVAVQRETVAKMTSDDPSRHVAKRLVDTMRNGASATKLNRALSNYAQQTDRK